MEDLKLNIEALKNGPYAVKGVVTVTKSDGTTAEYTNPHLCRCGASANKPFCDGSHRKVGFTD